MLATAPALEPPRRGLLASLPAPAWLVAMVAGLVLLAVACIATMSAARAYVGGEGRWSKAQKSAVLALLQYAETRNEADWGRYAAAIALPLGDRRAREALERPVLDAQAVREGFLAGGNHADDIAGMQRLYRWFRQLPFMARSIDIWAEADALVAELTQTADALRHAVQDAADPGTVQALKGRILALDRQLSPLQDRFSASLGEASRRAQWLLSMVLLAAGVAMAALAWALRRRSARQARQQAEALRHSEARGLRALNGSSDGFYEWDLRRGQAYLSPRFERLLGYAPGNMPRRVVDVQALLHPDDRAAAGAALKAHLTHAEPYDVELRMRHLDGSWRWLRSRAQADRGDDGHELRLSGSISDVTERRQAEEALRRREVQFRSLWETTSDAVLIIDAGHDIQFANPAAHAMFGHPAGSLVGQPLARLQPAHLREAHVRATAAYLRTGQRRLDWRSSELVGLHADGHSFPIEVCFSEIELGGEHQFVGFLRDITQRKQAEQDLRHVNERLEQRVQERTRALTEANQRLREVDRLKSEFLATMSHELRTPLNSVLGFTSLLLGGQSGDLNAEQRRQLGFVQGSGEHLLHLINDLLDLSRIESGRFQLAEENFDLVALAHEVCAQLQPMAQAKSLALRQDLPPALPMRGDRRRCLQVLLNLVNNALKFTPEGEVILGARPAGDRVEIWVQDTGIGIAPQDQALLFQPFRQVDGSLGRSHEGTGLGLYLCRRLLELMGGQIGLDSTPGAGTRFTVRLPPGTDAAASSPAPAPA
jgi:PAS domain S-box-containing protein